MALIAPAASAETVIGYHYTGKLWPADPLPGQPKVPGHQADGKTKPPAVAVPKGARELRTHTVVPAKWPAAATGIVSVAGTGGVSANASNSSGSPSGSVGPVRISAGPGGSASVAAKASGTTGAAANTPSAVRVESVDRSKAQAANVDGLLVGLTRADGQDASGSVSVALDYGSIAQAYGGGWASRLHLVAMPACALTTPQVLSCRVQQPLQTVNDPVSHTLTAIVALPGSSAPASASPSGARAANAAAAVSAMAVAAVAGTGGSQGSYTATSLVASGSWTQAASGAFTYNYPITVPPSLGGTAPAVGLSYNSQVVDGETSARNSQASWIGDGWNYSPGFIERQYRPCASDGITSSGDECWAGYNATLSLGSHTGQLVRDASGVYHLKSDDGTKIEDLSGAANGMWNGEYFKVTTTDGTAYYLGLNHSPGTTSDPATNSAWGAPVYFPNAGDPCYTSSAGKNSRCSAQPGWRFNLDFVVDPHGNVQRYDWANETNYYNMGYGQVAAAGSGGTLTPYTRGGYLTQISYGYKLADEQAGHDPAAKVVFNPAQRCLTDPTTCQYSNLSASTATNWPDVPYNLNCPSNYVTSGSGSNVCQVASPTFWSTVRLQSISTSVKTGSGWQPVDSYALTHLFSDAGGTMDPVTGKTIDPADAGQLQSVMWLSQIQHTGQDTSAGTSSSVPLPPVMFTGIETNNRVDGSSPPAPPLYRPRISSIHTDTGESIAVKYRDPECSRVNNTMPASPDSDTMACYQVYWTTPGAANPIADWFNKTLVSQVSDSDLTKAASVAKVTNYAYQGAAWHRDDSDLTDDQYRTWNDFRGYRTVTTTTGAAPDPITETVTSYAQGMDGDYKADGTQRSVKLNDGTPDSDWLAGMPQETDTYGQANGTIISKVLTSSPATTVVATSPRTAWTSWTSQSPLPATPLSTLPPLTALRIKSSSVSSVGTLANGGSRTARTDTAFDSLGRPFQVDDKGDLSVPAQERCTTVSYANPPTSNPMMLAYPSETVTVAGPCGTAQGSTTTITDKRVFYDGDGTITNPGTLGAIGTNGTSTGYVTATQAVKSYDGSGSPVFQTLGAISYDSYGRPTKTLDAAGSATTTAYTPASGILPTGLSTTNPLNWTASSTLAPARGLVTHASDANGKVTDATYDALGRRTQVWLPGRAMASQSPDRTFSYVIHGSGTNPDGTNPDGTRPDPSSVTTQTLREDQSYSTAVTIYDGFLQARQTQSTTADNSAGRLISSTYYDSHGWTVTSIASYVDSANAPGSTLWVETNGTGPSTTVTAYDGVGRPVSSQLHSFANTLWQATTAYPGVDETDSTPPSGGTPSSVFTNARGQKTSTVAHGGSGIGDVTTSYTYTPVGQVASVADNVGNTWTYGYDLQGRRISQSDPDTGTSKTTYDNLGHVATTTDGRNQVLSFTYDILGRKTGEYAGTDTTNASQQLASWTYDTIAGALGYPVSSTRYVGGSVSTGSAYTQQVAGYNGAYQPTGASVTIPVAEGNLARTYKVGNSYTPNVGLLSQTNYDADGGLPSEGVGYSYDGQGLLVASGTNTNTSLLDTATYTPLGQIQQSTYGNYGVQLRTAEGYDAATGRLTNNSVSIQTASTNPISYTKYGYDPAGNLATASEGQSSGGADWVSDTQCFSYDGLDRLTTAWTDTAGITSPTSGQLAHCNTANPSSATVGGPAPYWQNYTYNNAGDRTSMTARTVNAVAPVPDPSQISQVVSASDGTQTWAVALANGKISIAPQNQDGSWASFSDLMAQAGPLASVDSMSAAVNNGQLQVMAIAGGRIWHTIRGTDGHWQGWRDVFGVVGSLSQPSQLALTSTAAGLEVLTFSGGKLYHTVRYTSGQWQLQGWGDVYSVVGPLTGATQIAAASTASGLEIGVGAGGKLYHTVRYTNGQWQPQGWGDVYSVTGTLSGVATGAGQLALAGTTAGLQVISLANGKPYHVIRDSSGQWTTWADVTNGAGPIAAATTVGAAASNADLKVLTAGSGQFNYTKRDGTTQTWTPWASVEQATVNTNTTTTTSSYPPAKTVNTPTTNGAGTGGPHGLLSTNTTAPTGTQSTSYQYDPAGNTISRATTGSSPSSQSFTYDAEGRTWKTSTTTGVNSPQNTDYLYDADGSLLIQHSPGSTVLYLFGGAEQLTLNTTTGIVTGLRYYKNPDGTVIVRSSNGSLTYQPTNPQHTAQLQVDATTLAITRRSFDPYGNTRGATPSAWADNHAYLGQPADSTTGLSLLGARNYDPAIGRFLTVDPIFEASDPNQMGGYTYAGDNPTTGSDPNGLMQEANPTSDDGYVPPTDTERFWTAVGDNLTSFLDQGDPLHTMQGTWDDWTNRHWHTQDYDQKVWNLGVGVAAALLTDGDSSAELAMGSLSKLRRGLKAFSDLLKSDGSGAESSASTLSTGAELADSGLTSSRATRAAKNRGSDLRTNILKTDPASPGAPITPSAELSGSGARGVGGGTCSFTFDTLVLMADGSAKPIGDIAVGDQVQSADQETAKDQGARGVSATWIHSDEDLLDVTTTSSDGQTATVHTTSNHPFWDDTTHTWVPAAELKPGHSLKTNTGKTVRVTAIHAIAGKKAMYNLTVSQLHTYYVLAGTTPVLVHNTCDINDGYLYRGLAKGHHEYDNAAQGRAVPRGTHADIDSHTGGNDTDSIYTSWTDDPETAQFHAENLGDNFIGEGVMMRVRVEGIDPSRITQIHGTQYERFFEDEHLISGEIMADDISFDFGLTWSPVRR